MRRWLGYLAVVSAAGCATSTASRSYEADRETVRMLTCAPSMVAASPASNASVSNATVDACKPWQDTGVRVPRGAQVVVKAQGAWRGWPEELGYFGPEGVVGRPGEPSQPGPEVPWITPLALMGRLGEDGRPFEIGLLRTFEAEEEGALFLAINDSHLALEANHGSLSVRIIVLAPGPAPAP
jgi:hypothetical protein